MPDKRQPTAHQLDEIWRQLCTSIEARAGAAVIGTLTDQEGREVAAIAINLVEHVQEGRL